METVEGLHIATPRKNAILLVSVTVISLNSRNFFLILYLQCSFILQPQILKTKVEAF